MLRIEKQTTTRKNYCFKGNKLKFGETDKAVDI